MRAVRVLVVDDSALVRQTVTRILSLDPGITVVGTAADGRQALAAAEALSPDVVTLDLDMPVMDGLTCLGELVRRFRQRVVILSTLALENAFPTFKALALGALDFVTKPGPSASTGGLPDVGKELREKVLAAARIPREKVGRPPAAPPPSSPAPPEAAPPGPPPARPRGVIGVGGSTGGTVALEALLTGVSPDFPSALVAVQHLPAGFSASFARYLDSVSPLSVTEGKEGDLVRPRSAYLAPGDAHLRVQRTPQGLVLRVGRDTPSPAGYRPPIDVLLYSVAVAERDRATGILLSGMGEDGAQGLLAIKKLGGRTLVQDEASSVVYGIAERAKRLGAVDETLPLGQLAAALERPAPWRSA